MLLTQLWFIRAYVLRLVRLGLSSASKDGVDLQV